MTRSTPRLPRCLRLGVVPLLGMTASPGWAVLADGATNPAAGVAAGVATMFGVAGGAYALVMHRRLVRTRAALDEAQAAPRSAPSPIMPPVVEVAPRIDERVERLFRRAVNGGLNVEAWVDATGRFFWLSHAIKTYTGLDASEVLDGDFIDRVVYERDRGFCRDQLTRALAGDDVAAFELRLINPRCGVHWMSCHWQPISDEGGMGLGLRITMSDIQARKEAESKLLETVSALRRAQALSEHYLRRSNEERSRLSALLDVVRLGILFMDADCRVVYCNRALHEIWGMSGEESFIGVRDVVLQQHGLPYVADPEAYMAHVNGVLEQRLPSEPYEVLFRDGRIVTDSSRVVPGPDGGRALGRIWVFEDVTESRRVASQLKHMAERDPLTNLFNRRRFHEELDRMLADAHRHHGKVGLLAIDLDGFKPVNDCFGHQAGDEVLRSLANELGAVVRRNEMFFRLGGDEFAILVPASSEQELTELARRVCHRIAALKFVFDGEVAQVTGSIGIAVCETGETEASQLIGNADRAMYLAKMQGGNRWAIAEAGRASRPA